MHGQVIQYAISLGDPETNSLLIHILESTGAILWGDEIREKETGKDAARLEFYAREMNAKGQPFGTTVDSVRHNVGIPVFIVWEEG